jgi:hypothetical protein
MHNYLLLGLLAAIALRGENVGLAQPGTLTPQHVSGGEAEFTPLFRLPGTATTSDGTAAQTSILFSLPSIPGHSAISIVLRVLRSFPTEASSFQTFLVRYYQWFLHHGCASQPIVIFEEKDKTIYTLVLNRQEKYSIWPAHRAIPQGLISNASRLLFSVFADRTENGANSVGFSGV